MAMNKRQAIFIRGKYKKTTFYLLDPLLNKLLLQLPDSCPQSFACDSRRVGKFFQSRLPFKIIVAGPQNLKISLRSLLSNRSNI